MALTTRTSLPGSRAALLLAAVAVTSCSGDSSTGGGEDLPGAQLRADVLAGIGENVVVPLQETFASQMAALQSELDSAVAGTGTRQAAQDAWREAMATWQQLEVMQFGPSGSAVDVMGGQDIRARIYTWPGLSLCGIDRLTAGDEYDDPAALDAIPGVPRGLDAVEYLLFNDDPGNDCTDLDSLNDGGIWEGLLDEIPARRLAHAAATASLVRAAADDLVAAWAPDEGDFLVEVRDPTRGGAVYGSAQEGLNAISDAMFYLDEETEDMKLAEPAGISECDSQSCLDVESRWALASKAHLRANLEAFQWLFLGGAPGETAPGFDDLLVEMGAPDVADDMSAAIEAGLEAIDAIPGTLTTAIDEDPASVRSAYEAIVLITDILRAEVLSDLDLELPRRVEGDND